MERTASRVSVVIATRDRADYLREAIESVLCQTLLPLEVLVVDDGSVDDTAAVVRSFGPPVRLIQQESVGRSAARNLGVRSARGDLVAFLDDDDLWRADKLERQIEVFEASPECGLVHCFTDVIDSAGRRLECESREREDWHYRGLAVGYTFVGVAELCVMFTSTVMVRRDCLESVGLFDPAISALEDWDLYLRIARRYPIATIREPLVQYRVHPSNTSGSVSVEGRAHVARKHLALMAEEPSSPSQRAARFHLLCHLANAHYIQGDRGDCRRRILEAFRLYPRATMLTRLPIHFVASLVPAGLVRAIRSLRSASA
jgi:glycosyltransferase involved in cell wall biosynthesis